MTEASQDTEAGKSRETPSLYARARRIGGYAFWNAAAFSLPLGLDRLIVCPALNRHVGADVFGAFVWVIGIVNVFGLATSAGFGNYLMRDLAHRTPEDARRLLRTVFVATAGVGLFVLGACAFGSYWVADEVTRARAWVLYVPLCTFGVVRCLGEIVVATLRIQRLFSTIFVLKAIEGVVLLAVVLAAPSRLLWIVGAIYIVSVLLPLVVGVYLIRADIGWGRWWDGAAARCLRVAWPGLALSALIDHSVVNSPRIVLGALRDNVAVTELFVGTSMGNLFVLPMGILGVLVLSLLSSRTDFALAGRKGMIYLICCLGAAVGVGICSFLLGRLLVVWRYPDVAPATLEFYHWIAVANAGAAVIVLMRPVALRYARIRNIAVLSAATLGLELLMLLILVPLAGARGAAMSLAASSCISMCMWLGCFLVLMRRAARAVDTSEPSASSGEAP